MGTSSSIGGTIKAKEVEFSTNVSFNKPLLYTNFYKLTGNVNFSPITSNAVVGSCSVYKVLGNGVNNITFSSSIRKIKGSSNFNNGNDILNILIFFYDGVYFWVNIFQEENAQPIDLTSPTLSSAVISDGVRNKIILTFNDSLNAGSVPNLAAFTNSLAKTLSSVNISNSNVELTYTTNFSYGDVVSVSYSSSGNPLQDSSGNSVSNFTNQAVTNNITPPDVIAPLLQSATVSNSTPTKIVLTYNETLNSEITPSNGDYTLSSKTISGVVITGSTVEITTSTPFVFGDVVTISYTSGVNKVQDMNGNFAVNFSNQSITNNVSAGTIPLTFSNFTGTVVQSSNVLTATSGAYDSNLARATQKLAGDGYISFDWLDINDKDFVLGFTTTDQNQNYTGMKYFMWISGGTQLYSGYNGGAITASGITPQNGDKFRLRRQSTTIYLEYFRNNTWTNISWGGNGVTYSGDLFITVAANAPARLTNPLGLNVI